MSTLGTIALALAVPVYLVVLHALFSIPKPPAGDASVYPVSDGAVVATLALSLLWFFLAIALAIATTDGRFEWVAKSRASQFVLIFLAHLAAGFVTWASIARRHHPASSVPWSLRPLVPWAAFVIPPVVLLGCLFALHPPLGQVLPTPWYRGALTVAGAISLLAATALLIECATRRGRPPAPPGC